MARSRYGRTAAGPACSTRIWSHILLAAIIALILSLTLTPMGAPGPDTPLFDFELSGFRTLADAIANVILFVPLGAAAALALRSARRAVFLAFGLSLFIEAAQLLIPGRYTSPSDLAFNTVGGALGVLLAQHPELWLWPTAGRRRLLAWLALAAALTVLVGGSRLFVPSFPGGVLFGQWTPDRSPHGPYQGRVLSARVGPLDVPPWQVAHPAELRRLLLRGDTIRVSVEAADPPPGLQPIFRIADAEWPLVSLAAEGEDLVLSYRMRATRVGLDQPHLRFEGALSGVRAGDHVELTAWRHGHLFCLGAGAAERCGLGLSAAETWGLLFFPLPHRLALLVTLLWIPALLLPAGFWCRELVQLAIMGALVATALLSIESSPGVRPPGSCEISLAMLGLLLGFVLARVMPDRSGGPAPQRPVSSSLRD
jgi:VanZ family protein